jgi:hypothetical protein
MPTETDSAHAERRRWVAGAMERVVRKGLGVRRFNRLCFSSRRRLGGGLFQQSGHHFLGFRSLAANGGNPTEGQDSNMTIGTNALT